MPEPLHSEGHLTPPNSLKEWLLGWLATGFGVARIAPLAPGTFGAAVGIPLAWLLFHWQLASPVWSALLQIIVISLLVLAGLPICAAGQRFFGYKDPGQVVWDEVATMPIVFLFLPAGAIDHWLVLLVGFGLHRLIDITKPPPCRNLEKLPGGLGVMADDVVAAAYACLLMHALSWLGLFGTIKA